jgi:hypothetical protein
MKKKFDCVKMKRKGSAHVYQLVKDMSPEEELKFWREKTACLRRKGRKGVRQIPVGNI